MRAGAEARRSRRGRRSSEGLEKGLILSGVEEGFQLGGGDVDSVEDGEDGEVECCWCSDVGELSWGGSVSGR